MWSCDRYWTLRSWDRTIIPKPFSRIVLMYADPIHVAEEASRKTCEEARQCLDEQLCTMMYQADRYFESEQSDPRNIPVPSPVLRPDPRQVARGKQP